MRSLNSSSQHRLCVSDLRSLRLYGRTTRKSAFIFLSSFIDRSQVGDSLPQGQSKSVPLSSLAQVCVFFICLPSSQLTVA